MMTSRLRVALETAVLLTTLISTTVSAADPRVTIENFTFKPATITIPVGSSVTFQNVDDIPHSVVMTDGSFHSKALDTDDKVTIPFAKPGEFTYFCGLHPHMQGKVVVVP